MMPGGSASSFSQQAHLVRGRGRGRGRVSRVRVRVRVVDPSSDRQTDRQTNGHAQRIDSAIVYRPATLRPAPSYI